MRLSLRLLPILCLGAIGLTSPAEAQNENITYRSMAMQACDVEGYGGYGTYDACLEQTYYDLIHQGGYAVICYICVPNFTPAYEMPCYGTRLSEWCQVN